MDEHYNHLKTFKAAFTEIYQGDGISRTESGTLWLKKPSRMRWEYHVPREKLFLIDSQNAYFYVTGDRQAKKTPVKNLDDIRSPLRYLAGQDKAGKGAGGAFPGAGPYSASAGRRGDARRSKSDEGPDIRRGAGGVSLPTRSTGS